MARSKQTKKRVQQPAAESSEDEAQEYEVKSFLDHRRTKKKGLEYFVSWVGYSASHNSWEPAENVSTADLLLAKYWKNKSPAEELDRYDPGTSAYRKFLAAHPEVNPANKFKKNVVAAKSASASPPKKRTSSKRKADDEDDEEEEEDAEEEEEDVKPKATRRKSTGTTGATPKKRKSGRSSTGGAATTPQKKRAAKKAKKDEPEPVADESDSEEEEEEAVEEEEEEEEKEAPMAPVVGDAAEEDEDEESGVLVDWQTLPFAKNPNWEDKIDQVTTVRMDGEIPRGLTGQARLDAERKVRETMMKYLVRWRRQHTGSEEQLQSDVPNLELKKRAPQAIIRFFEARIKFRGADGAYAQPKEQEEEPQEEEEEEEEAAAAAAAAAAVEENGAGEVEAAGEAAAKEDEEDDNEEEEEEEDEEAEAEVAMAVEGAVDGEDADADGADDLEVDVEENGFEAAI